MHLLAAKVTTRSPPQVSLRLEGPPVRPVRDLPRLRVRQLHGTLAVRVRRQLGRTAVRQRSEMFVCVKSSQL